MAYIGRTRKNVTHAGNGREVHLPRVTNVKVDEYCGETNEIFEYLGFFGMGVLACEIDTSPSVKLMKYCWAGVVIGRGWVILGFRLEEGILSGRHHALPTPKVPSVLTFTFKDVEPHVCRELWVCPLIVNTGLST